MVAHAASNVPLGCMAWVWRVESGGALLFKNGGNEFRKPLHVLVWVDRGNASFCLLLSSTGVTNQHRGARVRNSELNLACMATSIAYVLPPDSHPNQTPRTPNHKKANTRP